jgi:hypothetical protein
MNRLKPCVPVVVEKVSGSHSSQWSPRRAALGSCVASFAVVSEGSGLETYTRKIVLVAPKSRVYERKVLILANVVESYLDRRLNRDGDAPGEIESCPTKRWEFRERGLPIPKPEIVQLLDNLIRASVA